MALRMYVCAACACLHVTKNQMVQCSCTAIVLLSKDPNLPMKLKKIV